MKENSNTSVEYTITKFSDLKCCPYCGCDTFYINNYAKGTLRQRYCPNGEEVDNEDIYDNLSIHYGKRVYCDNCNNYLGNKEIDKISTNALNEYLKNKEQGNEPAPTKNEK